MSRTGDQQASNAIVSGVSFYAGALQRAHEETAHYERLVHVLSEEKKATDAQLIEVIAERKAARNEVVELREGIEKLSKQVQDDKSALAAERRRGDELLSKYNALHKENERLQRVNIESHNERDKNVRSLREASEALGWFKGEAHRFIKELGDILGAKGFVIRNGDDVIAAVRKMAGEYNSKPNEEQREKILLRLGGNVVLDDE